jgi:hypothetical protein
VGVPGSVRVPPVVIAQVMVSPVSTTASRSLSTQNVIDEAVPEVSGNRNLYTLKYQYAS